MIRLVTAREQVDMLSPWRIALVAARGDMPPKYDEYVSAHPEFAEFVRKMKEYEETHPEFADLNHGKKWELYGAVDISPWAYIRHVPWKGGGMYKVHDKATRQEIGNMGYIHLNDGSILVNGLNTDDNYTHRGVATALLERMHADNPGAKINPGARSNQGEGLYQHLKGTEPEFKDVAIQGPQDMGVSGFRPVR